MTLFEGRVDYFGLYTGVLNLFLWRTAYILKNLLRATWHIKIHETTLITLVFIFLFIIWRHLTYLRLRNTDYVDRAKSNFKNRITGFNLCTKKKNIMK